MSTQSEVPNVPETPTHLQEVADQFTAAFNAAVAILPPLAMTHGTEATFVRTHLNVPPGFLAAVIDTVEQNPPLQVATGFDTAASREALQMIEALTPVLNRMTAVRDTLQHTLWSVQAALTNDALNVYAAAKGLGRSPIAKLGPVPLLSHINLMKETLGRRGPAKSVTPTPSPQQ